MNNPICENLLRLSFDTHESYLAYAREAAHRLSQIWLWHETLGNQEAAIRLPGVCDICQHQTTFTATPQKMPPGDQFAFRAPWWGGLMCGCSLPAVERTVIRCILDGGGLDDRIYHVGHHSPLHHWLSPRAPRLVSSQYEAGRSPGETENGIRYEDLTNLSFPDASFDDILCVEVLEHIPDHHAALREMARVLTPGGRAMLTFPWLGGEHFDHMIRAELRPDGTINHILPPEYHGDPADGAGILSFRSFGWKILDEIRAAGFSGASAKYVFGPFHGYASLLYPVIIGTR